MSQISHLFFTSPGETSNNPDSILGEDDVLLEAQVVDLRFNAVDSSVGVIFDLRTSLQFRESNTGVLIAAGVTAVQWSAEPGRIGRTARTVVGSRVRTVASQTEIALSLSPDSTLTVRGSAIVFHEVDVPDLDTIPNYVSDTDDEVQRMTPQWDSPARLDGTTRLSGPKRRTGG